MTSPDALNRRITDLMRAAGTDRNGLPPLELMKARTALDGARHWVRMIYLGVEYACHGLDGRPRRDYSAARAIHDQARIYRMHFGRARAELRHCVELIAGHEANARREVVALAAE